MGDIITKHLRIHGRVQGVGYRNWTLATAEKLGLTGWVRNRVDGSVEAVATGPSKDIEKFIAACYKGPLMARVKAIEINDGANEKLGKFEYRETL